jgi:hypothetical protein
LNGELIQIETERAGFSEAGPEPSPARELRIVVFAGTLQTLSPTNGTLLSVATV